MFNCLYPRTATVPGDQPQPPKLFFPRAKEVISSTASGAVYGAVSSALRRNIPLQSLSRALYCTIVPGCVTAALVGGVAGLEIVEKYGGPRPSKGLKVAGAAIGAILFGGASSVGAAHFLTKATTLADVTNDDLEVLEKLLDSVVANIVASIASKMIQTAGINLCVREVPASGLDTHDKSTLAKRDLLQAVRCLLDSLPRMSLLGIHEVTDSWTGAILIHTGVGFTGNIAALGWDELRGRKFGCDEPHQRKNREVKEGTWSNLRNKVGVSIGAAWGAATIAPAINDAGGVPLGWRAVVFAAIGCLMGAVFVGPAQAHFARAATPSIEGGNADDGGAPPSNAAPGSNPGEDDNPDGNGLANPNPVEDLNSDTDASGSSRIGEPFDMNINVPIPAKTDEVANASPRSDARSASDDDDQGIEMQPMGNAESNV